MIPTVKIKRTPTASGRDWKNIEKERYDADPDAYELYEAKPEKPKAEPKAEPDEPKLDSDLAELLAEAGFDTPEKIRAASDDDLRAVKGIGPAKLKAIRAI